MIEDQYLLQIHSCIAMYVLLEEAIVVLLWNQSVRLGCWCLTGCQISNMNISTLYYIIDKEHILEVFNQFGIKFNQFWITGSCQTDCFWNAVARCQKSTQTLSLKAWLWTTPVCRLVHLDIYTLGYLQMCHHLPFVIYLAKCTMYLVRLCSYPGNFL